MNGHHEVKLEILATSNDLSAKTNAKRICLMTDSRDGDAAPMRESHEDMLRSHEYNFNPRMGPIIREFEKNVVG